jgi:hypothetical protein
MFFEKPLPPPHPRPYPHPPTPAPTLAIRSPPPPPYPALRRSPLSSRLYPLSSWKSSTMVASSTTPCVSSARLQGCVGGGAPIMAATDLTRRPCCAPGCCCYAIPPTATRARPRWLRNRSRWPWIRTGGHVAQVSGVSKEASSSS